jgi:glycosyltransferase involved in cell wall biosynthesis
VAHNRYADHAPSGENVVVERELAFLGAAGVEAQLFGRSSDDIGAMTALHKAALVGSPIYARRTQHELSQVIRSFRPDVLHLHNPYPLLSPWVVRTARAHGVPVVHTVHNYRIACVAGTCRRDAAACTACLGTRTNWPAVAHGCYRGSRPQSAVMAAALAVHRPTWRQVSRFLAISETVAAHLQDLGIPRELVTVKPNIVPDPGRHDRRGEGLLFVGRLTEEKGVATLLASWASHPDGSLGSLRVVGDGPLRGAVERVAGARADVEFLGQLSPLDVQGEMRRAAAVVVPSLWAEPFGLVAVEALANARPVLATATGALPEIVGDDGGWLVPPDERALAEALPRVLREAPGRSARARARYEQAYAEHASVRRLVEVYAEVAGAGAGPGGAATA